MDAARVFLDNRKHVDGVLRRYGVPDQDVEDVAHEVFVKIAKSLGRASASFRGDARVGTWVYTIAKREALMYHRARRRHFGRLDRGEVEEHEVADESAPDARAVLEVGVEIRMIREALARVDERTRMVLQMYYLDEWPSEQIARVFGVKESTVKCMAFRARAKLARVLARAAA